MVSDVVSAEWHLARGGKQYGPISNAEMAKLVELGHLKPTDLVWRAGFTSWMTAARVSELQSVALPPPLPLATDHVLTPLREVNHEATKIVTIDTCAGFSDEALLGIHLVVPRRMMGLIPYTHHGIYARNGEVIHYAGYSDDPEADGNEIQRTTLKRFKGDGDLIIREHPNAMYSGKEAVERAQSRVNEDGYSLCANNCEHFCNWVIDGDHRSVQVDRVTSVAIPGSSGSSTNRVGVIRAAERSECGLILMAERRPPCRAAVKDAHSRAPWGLVLEGRRT